MKNILDEGYIEVCHINDGKEEYLTHWHPLTEEILDELRQINDKSNVLIMKKTFWGTTTNIVSLHEYTENIKKYKNNIFSRYFIIL